MVDSEIAPQKIIKFGDHFPPSFFCRNPRNIAQFQFLITVGLSPFSSKKWGPITLELKSAHHSVTLKLWSCSSSDQAMASTENSTFAAAQGHFPPRSFAAAPYISEKLKFAINLGRNHKIDPIY